MKTRKFCSFLGMFLVSLAILVTIIDVCSFSRGFYEKEYRANDTAAYIGMSHDSLMESTDALLDYLRDQRDDIVVNAEVCGTEREVFNERETLHMIDVRDLYHNAKSVRNFGALIGIILLAASLYKTENKRDVLRFGYRSGIGLLLTFILMIALWSLADFNDFWIMFHEVLFDNDLYILDPNTSIMINMFPASFFFHLVMKIILLFALYIVIVTVLLYPPNRKKAVS